MIKMVLIAMIAQVGLLMAWFKIFIFGFIRCSRWSTAIIKGTLSSVNKNKIKMRINILKHQQVNHTQRIDLGSSRSIRTEGCWSSVWKTSETLHQRHHCSLMGMMAWPAKLVGALRCVHCSFQKVQLGGLLLIQSKCYHWCLEWFWHRVGRLCTLLLIVLLTTSCASL